MDDNFLDEGVEVHRWRVRAVDDVGLNVLARRTGSTGVHRAGDCTNLVFIFVVEPLVHDVVVHVEVIGPFGLVVVIPNDAN